MCRKAARKRIIIPNGSIDQASASPEPAGGRWYSGRGLSSSRVVSNFLRLNLGDMGSRRWALKLRDIFFVLHIAINSVGDGEVDL